MEKNRGRHYMAIPPFLSSVKGLQGPFCIASLPFPTSDRGVVFYHRIKHDK
uniref:Uncharacterized protein n=1 Tax=Nelumbo nucifera TaxID=4432 RepID=A0A822ZM12_NELNU|nr:TPA_asm: hypothetical protein HUJ06_003740 [Nelumbo nucifera]